VGVSLLVGAAELGFRWGRGFEAIGKEKEESEKPRNHTHPLADAHARQTVDENGGGHEDEVSNARGAEKDWEQG
jgi:hypothetical protein